MYFNRALTIGAKYFSLKDQRIMMWRKCLIGGHSIHSGGKSKA